MDETKLKEFLNRFQPVGPRAELRVFALHPSRPDRVWTWAAAAAVLLAATVAVQVATTSALGRITPPIADPTSALADVMGGDEEAQRAAQLILTEQLIRGDVGERDVNNELEGLINASR